MTEHITIKGAREHNLKNISLQIPRNKMTVFTGVSGSGKSSLAFDTIFAEGQRRYVESLSAYARQFLGQLQKPDVDEIEGLSPAISIDQKAHSSNPRSTVATITEIYDYLRVLYARIGEPHCPKCGELIQKMTVDEIVDAITKSLATSKTSDASAESRTGQTIIFAPIVRGRKGEYYQLLYNLYNSGFLKIRIDGTIRLLSEGIQIDPKKRHTMELVVDTLYKDDFLALNKDKRQRISEAVETALEHGNDLVTVQFSDKSEQTFSAKFSCPRDGFSFPEIEPRLFSFNSPYGACPDCHGLGTKYFFGTEPCERCKGNRLREEALSVLVGNKNIVELTALSIKDSDEFFSALQIGGSASGGKKLTIREKNISKVVTKEIEARLSFMLNVGIEYLSLDRRAHTLSGGEAQRIRLASQLGSGLVGALYVLDETTIGLHARDNDKLIQTLLDLRNLGNTIIVVEHDEDTIFASDYIVDIGPKAGVHGGEVVVTGYLEDLLMADKNDSKSSTLAYLRGEKKIEIPETRRTSDKGSLKIEGGKIFNIKNIKAEVPLGKFVTITGVSGSGKSSFMYEILHKNLRARFDRKYRSAQIFNCSKFTGSEYLSRAILINQSPIGRTSRSNPATYTGAFTHIRDMFAATSEARARGWKANRFFFNVKGGRCEACEGKGEVAVEMHFLPTVHVNCDICNGKRFTKETLEIKYRGKNIHEVLSMTAEEALSFFEEIPSIYDRLKTLCDVGLGYLELGQPASTLSGGESQRVKISSELYRPITHKTIYLLDEPTIGLHYDDVKKLIEILQKLVVRGNTVVVIEHNMDLIKSSDYIIDIGPDGGINGGKIVAKGTPEEVANTKGSYTGEYLKKHLK